MSELFSAEVHAGVGVVWGQSRPWTPALCASSFLAITTRPTHVHFTNICMRIEDPQKLSFPVGWPSSPTPGHQDRCMENWEGRNITSSESTPLKTASHSSPVWEDKTPRRDGHRRQRREIEPHGKSLPHFVLILRVGRQKEVTRAGPLLRRPPGRRLFTGRLPPGYWWCWLCWWCWWCWWCCRKFQWHCLFNQSCTSASINIEHISERRSVYLTGTRMASSTLASSKR